MSNLNAEIVGLISHFCTAISDDTAATVLELARAIVQSPLTDDGCVAYAQWVLQERCDHAINAPAKTVVIDGCSAFRDQILAQSTR